jgi:hypothetical protein
VPSCSGCRDTNVRVRDAVTLDPGVYCNGITVNASGVLTVNPGVSILDRRGLTVNGGGFVTAAASR